jgi:hypothetical protein
MAYLSKAMSDILTALKSLQEREQIKRARECEKIEAQKKRELEAVEEEKAWLEKERAFRETFPTEDIQQAVVAELCLGMPFKPQSEAGRSFAISLWWQKECAPR